MRDPRIIKTAKILVNYSTKVKKGDIVQIVADQEAHLLALEVLKQVLLAGGHPKLHVSLPDSRYTFFKYASESQLKHFPKEAMYEIKNTDAVIYIGAPNNTRELSNINPKKMGLRQKTLHPIQEYRVNKTKWVVFYYPTSALAQDADMALTEFRHFVFSATNKNWEIESKKQNKLKKVLDKGKTVRIVGHETDITFSIKGRGARKCDGQFNMPDGEVFIAPDEKTANGEVAFSFPAIYGGKEVDGIKLKFKDGVVIKATAEKNEKFLKHMLKTDEGASRLGEFGIGVNYQIKRFTRQILFDEKIGGTIHLALGSAYKEGGGKNRSAIHWDMIKDLRRGGKIYVDGKPIQKHGDFKI